MFASLVIKFLNASSVESSNYSNARAKDDADKKWAIPYNQKKTWPELVLKITRSKGIPLKLLGT